MGDDTGLNGSRQRSVGSTDDPDVQLMLRFQQGSEEAFVQLYHRHRDRVCNLARRLLGSQADGEEAAQEIFLKLYALRTRYEPRSRFLTFLLRMTINHSLNVKARHERSRRDSSADVHTVARLDGHTPEGAAVHTQLRESIAAALKKLPDKQAAAFVLCHFDGQSCAAAADILEVSEGAVKQLIFRARASLSQSLAALAEVP